MVLRLRECEIAFDYFARASVAKEPNDLVFHLVAFLCLRGVIFQRLIVTATAATIFTFITGIDAAVVASTEIPKLRIIRVYNGNVFTKLFEELRKTNFTVERNLRFVESTHIKIVNLHECLQIFAMRNDA